MVTFEANCDDPGDDDANVSWVREGIAETRELPVVSGGYGNLHRVPRGPGPRGLRR